MKASDGERLQRFQERVAMTSFDGDRNPRATSAHLGDRRISGRVTTELSDITACSCDTTILLRYYDGAENPTATSAPMELAKKTIVAAD